MGLTSTSVTHCMCTLTVTEQNALMALSIANRGYVLQTGQIVVHDDAAALKNNEMVQKAYLGMD